MYCLAEARVLYGGQGGSLLYDEGSFLYGGRVFPSSLVGGGGVENTAAEVHKPHKVYTMKLY